jgi:Asp/Glu/hydantoin racemase
MRILVVNVNTTESMTKTIAGQARAVAADGRAVRLVHRRGRGGRAALTT